VLRCVDARSTFFVVNPGQVPTAADSPLAASCLALSQSVSAKDLPRTAANFQAPFEAHWKGVCYTAPTAEDMKKAIEVRAARACARCDLRAPSYARTALLLAPCCSRYAAPCAVLAVRSVLTAVWVRQGNSLFVYCGHGSGNQYLKEAQLQRTQARAVVRAAARAAPRRAPCPTHRPDHAAGAAHRLPER
jgi:hypothetical protein